MKTFKKTFAGIAAMALALSMTVIPASAEDSTFDVEDPDTGAWQNCFGDDYFDFHTLPRDTDLTFTIEVKLSDTFISMMEADPDGSAGLITGDEQIGLAPTSMTPTVGWKHLGEEVGYVTGDFPVGSVLKTLDGASDGTYKLKAKTDADGNVKTDKDGNVMYEEDVYMANDDSQIAPLYEKPDGFIKWNDSAWKDWGSNTQTLSFTISGDCVNFILDEIAKDMESGEIDAETGANKNEWGGILFQCSGNFEVNKVTINYPGILLNSQYNEWAAENPDTPYPVGGKAAEGGDSEGGESEGGESEGGESEGGDSQSEGGDSKTDGGDSKTDGGNSQSDGGNGGTSGGSTTGGSTTGGSTTGGSTTGGSTTGGSTTGGSTNTAGGSNNAAATNNTANPAASGDNTASGAGAGIALAGIAAAGALIAITKKR